MKFQNKKQTASIALLVLGAIILVIGAMHGMLPPIITGLGFLIIAWAL